VSYPLIRQYCEEYGIDLEALIAEPEAAPCSAYARYILDVGNSGDVMDLYMAVASCLIGYGEVGLWIKKQVDTGAMRLEGNPYRRWIETYCGEDFLKAINTGIGEFRSH
jgi:hydroxymethylpyrimidine/phosphomethylpyrimidine kinase